MSRSWKYLIVGGGMTADAAVRGIRQLDPEGSIGLISAESDPPYKRPPLSKGLWSGTSLDSIWSRTEAEGVDLHLRRTVRRLDTQQKTLVDDADATYEYEKLLLATGVRPRTLPFSDSRIIYFRTLADYRRLREQSQSGDRFAVIGGGFIGSEIAAALAANGKRVSLIFPEEGIGSRLYPQDLALSLNDYFRERGVEVLNGTSVESVEPDGDVSVLSLHLAGGEQREIVADGVIAGVGALPNVEFHHLSGIEVDNGIVVDPLLQTSHSDIYAAGDVANVSVPALGERRRVEHEDSAKTMGAAAGRSMAGATAPYEHLPSFYSDLFDLGYEAVGDLDARMSTVAHWTVPFREGIVYYLRDDRIRGVLLWNVWGQVNTARELIASCDRVDAETLRGTLLVAR